MPCDPDSTLSEMWTSLDNAVELSVSINLEWATKQLSCEESRQLIQG